MPKLDDALSALTGVVQARFAPPEYLSSCDVQSIADIDEYSTNNGWIEALCGRHNQQRVRYKAKPLGVAVNDIIDVIYYPEVNTFESIGAGGTISPADVPFKLISPDGATDPVISADNSGDLTMLDGAAGDLLFADRSEGQLFVGRSTIPGIVTETPSEIVDGGVLETAESGAVIHALYAFGGNAQFRARRAQGTATSPTAMTSGNVNFRIQGGGYDGTALGGGGDISFAAVENWAVGAHGSEMQFRTVPTGSATQTRQMVLSSEGLLGVGGSAATTPLAVVHADQDDATAAIPALYLDQADVSEEMIEFNTTIGTGNAIEAVGAKSLTVTHFVKVTIPGSLTRYFAVGTIA